MSDRGKSRQGLRGADPKRCRAALATALQRNPYSRRDFLATAIAAPALLAALPMTASAAGEIIVSSPDGKVKFHLHSDQDQLRYRVSLRSKDAIDRAALGIIVNDNDLGRGTLIRTVERYQLHETYQARGGHSQATNNCNGARIAIRHIASNTNYVLEVRTYNDGIAFRHLVPGIGSRVPDEGTGFTIPAGSTVWFHDFEGHYEGIHQKKEIAAVKEGEWAAPPLTVKLPGGSGYLAITEAALINYAGMGLRADGQRGFKAVLGHSLPVSHPFDLRYGKEEAKRLSKPAAIDGTITTPWRVVMIAADLNTLINCDIVNGVSPPPDKIHFPNGSRTDWVKPGRAVWKYLDGGDSTFEGMKEFSRLAGQLGFEYNVVEGFWQRWPESQMRDLVLYSNQQKVGLWVWKHSKDLRTPAAREDFFSLCQRVGFVGAKIDFFDHEAKEIIDLYQALLSSSAGHKIMVEFHGANKPAGESYTWPNEMTREAIRGLEYRSMATRARHNTTIPFTRFLAGPADYTPLHFGERRKETSWAHQIASAIVFTSPLMIYGAHPKNILDNPAVDLIKSIPSVWDQTIALPPSEIGVLAAFARRSGDNWFLGVMNGETEKSLRLSLSFLSKRKYEMLLVRDQKEDYGAVKIERSSASRNDTLTIDLRAGGGFAGRFVAMK